MPERSEKLQRLNEQADDYELPYISKSRVKSWVENPEHFRLKYLEGIKEEETEAMRRGTEIHETFEEYYETLRKYPQTPPRSPEMLCDDRSLWSDHMKAISNFMVWETERALAAPTNEERVPVGIEEEVWLTRPDLPGPQLMGIADAVLYSSSVPSVEADKGVTIVDFKTGSVPSEKYRAEGIYLELAYYEMIFEGKYDITGTVGFYPTAGETVVREPGTPEAAGHRDTVMSAIEEMCAAADGYDGEQSFETKPGPLCKWGEGSDEESSFYGICSECSWGVPANNKNTFVAMLDEGHSPHEVADELGTTVDAVYYWKRKFNK